MKKNKPITRVQIKNTDPEYWEKVLESHGLGKNIKYTDSSDEASDSNPMTVEEMQKKLTVLPIEPRFAREEQAEE